MYTIQLPFASHARSREPSVSDRRGMNSNSYFRTYPTIIHTAAPKPAILKKEKTFRYSPDEKLERGGEKRYSERNNAAGEKSFREEERDFFSLYIYTCIRLPEEERKNGRVRTNRRNTERRSILRLYTIYTSLLFFLYSRGLKGIDGPPSRDISYGWRLSV